MNNKSVIIIVFLGFQYLTIQAQNSYEKFCNLINVEDNLIHQEQNLTYFFEQLTLLDSGKIDQVNILHIGDSHIQADWFSGQTRVELQREFGNAGRGLVFPYHVAGSNSPSDVYSKSNYEWEAYRNIHNQDKYEIGVSGFVIATKDTAAYLKLALNDKYDMGGYGFNKITVFHTKNDDLSQLQFFTSNDRDVIENNVIEEENIYYSVKSGDNLGAIAAKFNSSVSFIKKANGLKSTVIYPKQKMIVGTKKASKKYLPPSFFTPLNVVGIEENPYSTSYYFKDKMEFIFVKNSRNNQEESFTQWDGFVLEDTTNFGVLYHTVGVNGAKFKDYNKSEEFFTQSSDLHADLIIVSLGTNESLDKNLSEEEFVTQMDTFFTKLRMENPKASILITTPMDNQKAQAKVASLASIIKNMAIKYQFAYFDFYNILKGKDAFYRLRVNGFAQRDGVHLNAKGYQSQGKLLSDAIKNSYHNYHIDADI